MDMMAKLDGFVREAVGHKYAISLAKILQRKTVAMDESKPGNKYVE